MLQQRELRLFENWVLRRKGGTKITLINGDWRNCMIEIFVTCTPSRNISRVTRSRRIRGAGRDKVNTQDLTGKPEGETPLER
jgi:hypothetical protein